MTYNSTSQSDLPATGYARQSQLVRNPKNPIGSSILPFSAATLWRMVKAGKFPRPVRLSERITAWRVEEIRAWMAQFALQGGA